MNAESAPLFLYYPHKKSIVKKQNDNEVRSRTRKTCAPCGRLKAQETMRRVGVSDVCIRSMEVLQTAAGVLIEDVYFEGGDVLRCYEGRFRFTLEGREPFVLGAGQALVIYPNQKVTIKALDKKNTLRYAIFDGTGAADYFDSFGFFDGLHGKTSTQQVVFERIKRSVDAGDNAGVMSAMSDALVTYAHDLRSNGNALVFDAVRQIRANLAHGAVRLQDLSEALGVSRSQLHRVFAAQDLGSVSEFVKREQLRLALRLLRETRKPIAEIARAAGFLTVTHFATFMKRRTGHSPRDLRR